MSPWLRFYVFNLAWRSNKLWKCRPGHPEPPAKIQKALPYYCWFHVLNYCQSVIPAIPQVPKFGYNRNGKYVAVKPQCFPQADRVKMNVKLVHWFNTCMFLNIVSFGLSLSCSTLVFFRCQNVCPKRPSCRRKERWWKSQCISKAMEQYVRAFVLTWRWCLQIHVSRGPFSATTRANTTFLSQRGSQDTIITMDIIEMCLLMLPVMPSIVFGSRTSQIRCFGQKVFPSPARPRRLTSPSSSMSTQTLQNG